MTTKAMRAQFEAWWESTERDVSFPHEAAWASYQAALSSPAVVALVDALMEVHRYDSAEHGDVSLIDADDVWDRIDAALAPFITGAAQLAKGEEK